MRAVFFGRAILALLVMPLSMLAHANDLDLQKQAAQNTRPCALAADPQKTQYIVGYGSLMQSASRERTVPQAGPALPLRLTGYQRGWFALGNLPGFNTTFLGAVPDPAKSFNAVAFSIPVDALADMDERENFYCRIQLERAELTPWVSGTSLPEGQYWMYINGPHAIGLADRNTPIVESYVDIFLGGCLQLERRFKLSGFARECIVSTSEWSSFWVNDRLYPRRPFIYQPQAQEIDQLLHDTLPDLFAQIRIE